jgi:tripartite-type tricarboxylate transporter receptor subunit TctC
MSPVIRQKPRKQTRQASSTCLSAEPAYGNDHHDVGEAINGKAFDGSGGSLDSSRNEDYPGRTVTIIVPFAAGGPADITGRIVADIFNHHLGQKFVVENAGGAGGTVGTLRAARAAADGYTILSGHLGTNALAPAFYPDLGYDPQRISSRSD